MRAGFVLCGRTNTPEFGPITVAENDRYGVSRNPWDPSRSPGGSSGGAAAAVASGMFPIAHANDGGGSIRIPSSYCGLVGLKSSRARVPRRVPEWLGAVVEGVATRTVADAAAVLDATAGPDPLAWNNALAPARPFAEELGAAPAPLRIGLMAEAPLGIPTDPALRRRRPRRRGAARGARPRGRAEVEVPTISAELVPPSSPMAPAGLAAYDGVDWARVEPHNRHSRGRHRGDQRLRLRRRRADAGATHPPRGRPLGTRLRRDADPDLGDPAAPRRRRPRGSARRPRAAAFDVVARSLHRLRQRHRPAGGSLPLHWTEEGLPVGTMLTGGPWEEATLIWLAARSKRRGRGPQRRPAAASV